MKIRILLLMIPCMLHACILFAQTTDKTLLRFKNYDVLKGFSIPVELGMDGRVGDVAYHSNGTAWLCVVGQGIAYTKDFGFTWTKLSIPKKKKWYERFNKIYFNTRQEGIAGSGWNAIAYTSNNCKTWTNLPTPLDQKKYYKSDIKGSPEIDKVAIFNDYLLVSQQHQVFYSTIDTVNWVYMPGYADFNTDTENSTVSFKHRRGYWVKYDSHLQPISIESIAAPKAISQADSNSLKKEMVESFCSKEIKTILFSKGLAGCFEQSSDTLVYELKEDRFVLSRRIYPYSKPVDLKDSATGIDKQVVANFVKIIPAIYQKKAAIDEFGFTEQDYDTCKRNILAFKATLDRQIRKKEVEEQKGPFDFYVNNLDFPKLLTFVDSVKTVDPNVLDSYFSWYGKLPGNMWVRLILVNADNEVLEIENMSFGKPSPFYFPWVIRLDGRQSSSKALEINRFLHAVFPNFLDYKTNKVAMVQELVKWWLYWPWKIDN